MWSWQYKIGIYILFYYIDNGADGLVVARYLKIYGYNVDVVYIKDASDEIYNV